MKIAELIKERRSVRSYKDMDVPDEKLISILNAARMAPSAGNRQPWKFIVVREKKKREALGRAASGQGFVAEAPVVIAAVALYPDRVMECGVPSYAVDLAIAVDHMTLAAVEEGLGTCWIGAFSQNEVRKILGIPQSHTVVTLLPLGFPADTPRSKIRRPLEEIVCYESFS
ncbi:nitroreductase [candidate division TA06 bacterium DG_26]|uniref:Nitroreductase n=1 Tax=candidate division TA06 bacterium DG_26 TaxID=1703771 RepID=A0A0S7WJX2_UNCT6|nr:MAG: nitroreductase [candidate division TA06 bacterium DG_26]